MRSAGYSDLTLYRRLLRQARPYWPHIGGILLLSLLSTPLSLLTPLPLKIAVDSVVGSKPVPDFFSALLPAAILRSNNSLLILTIGLLVTIALLSEMRGLGYSLLRTYTGEKLVLEFRAQLFRHVQHLSLSSHDSKDSADLNYRIQWDAPSIQHVSIDGIIPLITSSVTLVSMLYVVLGLDWQLGLIALSISPFLFVVSWTYRWHLRRRSREVKKLESAALSVAQEVLADLRVVQAFGQEDREQERFVRRSHEGVRARLTLASQEGTYGLIVGLLMTAGTAGVLLVGLGHVQTGSLTLGELLMVISYLSQLYAPLKTISNNMTRMQSHLAGAERAFAVLDEPPGVVERPNARSLSRAAGAITFRNVSFAYEERNWVLRNVSFGIPPGARVAITGRSGAGKTTLLGLVIRFFDPTEGQILLDGVDLRDYKLAHLRNQFGIVLQEPVLFSASIAENIAYARPGASFYDIVKAAKAARSHDFIVRLPQGYDTQIGERGLRLSGGERQRVSLARAFLKNAPILVFDEPTSSVDLETEALINEAMDRLVRGRTSFTIAHRLSTLERCNVRLRVEDGIVIEDSVVTPAAADREPLLKRALREHKEAKMMSRGVDEYALHGFLQCVVPDVFGYRSTIDSVERRETADSTFACSDITIRLATGDEAKVFRKDLGLSRHPKDGIELRRERELSVYRDILAGTDLGTANYLGAVWDEQCGRFWLFLEFVAGTPVRYSDFKFWLAAAAWLGRSQGFFTQHPERLDRYDFLERHDQAFFRSKAELALQRVSRVAPGSALRLGSLLKNYDRTVELMANQPQTLVHGSFGPRNILVGSKARALRVCPVDWELAALGSPFYDLAFLSEGFEPPKIDRLCQAYRVETAKYGVRVPGSAETAYLVGCFRLHKIVKTLSESINRKLTEGQIEKLISRAEAVSKSLFQDSRQGV